MAVRSTARPAAATGAQAHGAVTAATVALGALALGALAIGAMAIGRLTVGRARVKRLEIDELVVHRLRVTSQLTPPLKSGAGSKGCDVLEEAACVNGSTRSAEAETLRAGVKGAGNKA